MTSDEQFDIETTWIPGEATVTVRGEVDLATAPELEDGLMDVIGTRPSRLVVDLAQLRFIDGRGISVLARAGQQLAVSLSKAVLRGPNALTRQLIDISGLDRLWTVEERTPPPTPSA